MWLAFVADLNLLAWPFVLRRTVGCEGQVQGILMRGLRHMQVFNVVAAVFMAQRMVETKRQSLHDIHALLVGPD